MGKTALPKSILRFAHRRHKGTMDRTKTDVCPESEGRMVPEPTTPVQERLTLCPI